MVEEAYLAELEQWRAEQDAAIRRDNDQLALAGLFWLQKGFNTFGSSRDCDILLPKPAHRIIGAFEFDGTNVTLSLDLGQSVHVNGEPIKSATVLNTDETDIPSYVTYGDLRMVAVRRAHGVGVRLWDNCRPERRTFPPRAWFPASDDFIVTAAYTPYPGPMKVQVTNAMGEVQTGYVNGYVAFRLLGRSHRLEAAERNDARLRIQFKDTTNGMTTYPGGRYVDSGEVNEEGLLTIDFNRAFNPGSAFSRFSTSTFAHKRNQLKVPVEAGEKFSPVA